MGKTIYGFIEKIYMFFVELLFKIKGLNRQEKTDIQGILTVWISRCV